MLSERLCGTAFVPPGPMLCLLEPSKEKRAAGYRGLLSKCLLQHVCYCDSAPSAPAHDIAFRHHRYSPSAPFRLRFSSPCTREDRRTTWREERGRGRSCACWRPGCRGVRSRGRSEFESESAPDPSTRGLPFRHDFRNGETEAGKWDTAAEVLGGVQAAGGEALPRARGHLRGDGGGARLRRRQHIRPGQEGRRRAGVARGQPL